MIIYNFLLINPLPVGFGVLLVANFHSPQTHVVYLVDEYTFIYNIILWFMVLSVYIALWLQM